MRSTVSLLGMLIAGLMLLAAGPIALGSAGPATFGQAPAAFEPLSVDVGNSPVPFPDKRPGTTEARTAPDVPREVTVRSARIDALPVQPSPPTAIRVESLSIAAPVDPVGMSDRVMDVPTDVGRAGWFEPGVAPGSERGSAVLSAHVDSRTQGEGAFYALRDATEGDRVEVDTKGAGTLVFEVTARTHYDKSELPSAELFRRDGPHQIVLITCGGAFDEQTRSYKENTVVIARPVDR